MKIKKTLLIIIVVIAIIGIILGITRKFQRVEIINLIPQNAAFYISVNDLGKVWGDFEKSHFWEETKKIKVWEKVKKSQKWEFFNNKREKFEKGIGLRLNENNLKEILGKQIGLALFESQDSSKPDFLFLTEVGVKTKLLRSMVKIRDKSQVVEQYKGFNIEGIKLAERKLYWVFINNVALITTNISILKEVINIYKGAENNSLVKGKQFKEIISKLPLESKGLVYFKRERLINALPFLFKGRGEERNRGGGRQVDFMEAVVGKFILTKEGVRIESYTLFKQNFLNEELRQMYKMKPQRFKSLEFIPQNTLFYGAENALDTKVLWNSLLPYGQKNKKTYENIKESITKFERKFNLKIEDILSWINSEIACIIPCIDLKGPFPSPKFVFLLGIKDKAKVMQTLTAIEKVVKEKEEFKIENKEYKGVEVKFIRLPIVGKDLRPAYTLVGNFLIVSSAISSLEEILDVYQSKTNLLVESQNFQVVKDCFTKETKGLYYIDVARSLDISLEVLKSFSPLLCKKEEEKAKLEEVVYPILKVLKVFKTLGISIARDEEGLKEIFFCSIKDLAEEKVK